MKQNAAAIRVLLVDDQALLRQGVAVIINSQTDMTVVGEASDGAEALSLVDRLRPDVVLMDVRMEPVDGVEAARLIFSPTRIAAGGHRPQVLMLTTFAMDDRAALAIRYGATGFLLKDSKPEDVIDAVRRLHQGSTALAQEDLSKVLQTAPVPYENHPALHALNAKELEIFRLAVAGYSNLEIGEAVFLSESSIKTYISTILRKLSLKDRVQLVLFAARNNLLPPE